MPRHQAWWRGVWEPDNRAVFGWGGDPELGGIVVFVWDRHHPRWSAPEGKAISFSGEGDQKWCVIALIALIALTPHRPRHPHATDHRNPV
jgi:hypothetical protein